MAGKFMKNLTARDNSGGPGGPRYSAQFGDGGKVTGGEPSNPESKSATKPGYSDEMPNTRMS